MPPPRLVLAENDLHPVFTSRFTSRFEISEWKNPVFYIPFLVFLKIKMPNIPFFTSRFLDFWKSKWPISRFLHPVFWIFENQNDQYPVFYIPFLVSKSLGKKKSARFARQKHIFSFQKEKIPNIPFFTSRFWHLRQQESLTSRFFHPVFNLRDKKITYIPLFTSRFRHIFLREKN